MENESIHAGHRQRLKNRFLNEGLDHFSEHQVLELMLFYTIPRQDTNLIAHKLISHFGTLNQVLEATPEEMKKVSGLGDASATFLSLLNAFCRYYYLKKAEHIEIINSVSDCARMLIPLFHGRKNETVYMLCLDAKCKLLCCKKVGEGSVNSAAVPIRRIVEIALGANASSVILAHNHPSGLALPSEEDQLTTRQLATALSAVDIILADHMVVADGECVSMQKSGLYQYNQCQILV